MAAALAALSACAVMAADDARLAGATVRIQRGWTASLFVNPVVRDTEGAPGTAARSGTAVNGEIARRIGRRTTLSLDVLNIFDRRPGEVDRFALSQRQAPKRPLADDPLSHLTEPRGIMLRLRRTF